MLLQSDKQREIRLFSDTESVSTLLASGIYENP